MDRNQRRSMQIIIINNNKNCQTTKLHTLPSFLIVPAQSHNATDIPTINPTLIPIDDPINDHNTIKLQVLNFLLVAINHLQCHTSQNTLFFTHTAITPKKYPGVW